MPHSPWQQRMQRAQDLMEQHAFAAEILEFYVQVAGFQEALYRQLERAARRRPLPDSIDDVSAEPLSLLASQFDSFLSLVRKYGPAPLAKLAHELRERGNDFSRDLLQNMWRAQTPSDAQGFLAQAFLQPYAELVRSQAPLPPAAGSYASCPFCHRKPSLGVLRPMGEGAARSLVCGFCLAEWTFRRLVCPACGEEDDKKLPVFTASEFDYIRVECCEACKTYLKTIDLTKNGRADPLVDELASAPLDLWAREHGYGKLQPNLLGM